MPFSRTRVSILVAVLALIAAAIAIWGNQQGARQELRQRAEAIAGGNAAHGQVLFAEKGCGGCHTLKGATQAAGLVGPPLDGVGQRAMIVGMLANNPDNLARWIREPQKVVPGNAMPNLPMTPQDSRDLAAFLYSQG
jgi:cytochrome c2